MYTYIGVGVVKWLFNTMFGLWPKSCEFDPGSQQLLGDPR